ncbi:MAG: hypothetical protein V4773_08130 [Verrucomicrobiota bacterium]
MSSGRATFSSRLSGGWLVMLAAALLALRKPWALHTPQLWAEDGSIFLIQNDLLGLRAWFEPYNGYLHLLPRLIAWSASHVADVAAWPAWYNGVSFALTVALFARLASSRIALPEAARSWLVLALPLVVGTGEPLLNITNLQWVTALFLVAQLFATRPTTLLQRLGDLAILLVVGLNGPFAIVLLPLFFWRALRERHVDAWLAAAAIAVCAGVQFFLLSRTGTALTLEASQAGLRPLMFVSVIGSRLVTWPLFGPTAVRAWPIWLHAVLAIAVIAPLLVWSLRRDPLRPVRAFIGAAFVLLTVACVYRVRADLWDDDNLVNGDRYFYLSRVLLTWLVILEFAASPRWIALVARGICVLSLLTHLPHFIIPAPPDYRWSEHCAPIRRGAPTQIKTLPEGYLLDYPGRPPRR